MRSSALLHVAAVAAAAVLLAGPVASAAQTETERVDRTIPFAAGGTLVLKNFSGEVRITGADREEVVIHAVRRAPRERLDRIRLDIEVSGSRVAIDANKREDAWWGRRNNNVVETEFEIQVPSRTSLDINVFSSDLRITGVGGEHTVQTFSGSVDMRDVTGPVEGKTFSGRIGVEVSAGTTEPALELETFSGDIEARLPDGSSGRLRFSSFSGDIRSDHPLTLQRQTRRNLEATLGSGGGRELRFKTFSGDVEIRR